MTTLKRIVVASYQTADGQTFTDKNEAAKHQAHLDRLAKIKDLFVKATTNAVTAPTDEMASEVAQFIVDNADALREILPKRAKPAVVAPASQTGLIGDVEPALGLNAHDTLATPAAQATPAFSFPAGLVNNVGNQQALANA